MKSSFVVNSQPAQTLLTRKRSNNWTARDETPRICYDLPKLLSATGHGNPQQERDQQRTKRRFARDVTQMLNGIPGFRPASIAPITRLTVLFTASETSAMVDFDSGTGSRPS
jgi:hypothetical protein